MKRIARAFRHKDEQDKAPLRYRGCGLDDVYLLSGYELVRDADGEEGVSIKHLDELHVAIGCYLASQKKVLAPKELRFLRMQMGLTQSELGKLIGLSSQQVARWEKGQSEISGAADLLVRALFIEHRGGKFNLQKLAQRLEEIDAPMKNEKSYFEISGEGWKKAA